MVNIPYGYRQAKRICHYLPTLALRIPLSSCSLFAHIRDRRQAAGPETVAQVNRVAHVPLPFPPPLPCLSSILPSHLFVALLSLFWISHPAPIVVTAHERPRASCTAVKYLADHPGLVGERAWGEDTTALIMMAQARQTWRKDDPHSLSHSKIGTIVTRTDQSGVPSLPLLHQISPKS